jgi:hypothetical protein
MTSFKETIRLFLLDGVTGGRWECEVLGWSGKGYKIPRKRLKECKDTQELQSTGTYFLFGENADGEKPQFAYIGESETVYTRLNQHLNEPYEWNEAVVFIANDENLNKACIKYLERLFYEKAKEADRYDIVNPTTPTKPKLSKSDEAFLEKFAYHVLLIMPTIGHMLFEPYLAPGTTSAAGNNEEPAFHLERKSKKSGLVIKAACRQTDEAFVVLKGSMIEVKDSPKIPKTIKELREKYIRVGTISPDGILQNDVPFKSASYAGAFVIGGHINGRTEWKNTEGKSLKEVEENAVFGGSQSQD